MKKLISLIIFAFMLACSSPKNASAVKVGDPAPNFSALDSNGNNITLADFRGKFVVLEWFNDGCPYVKKHYQSGNMQKLQKEWTERGVVWLAVLSSAPGKQGHKTGPEINAHMKASNGSPSGILLDPEGKIGRTYGAKTTPHMYIVNPQGRLIYMGAIDDNPSSDPADIPASKNYVRAALGEAMAGNAVSTAATTPYGCSVKYN